MDSSHFPEGTEVSHYISPYLILTPMPRAEEDMLGSQIGKDNIFPMCFSWA